MALLLNWRLWVAMSLVALTAWGYFLFQQHDKKVAFDAANVVQVKWDKERLAIASESLKLKSENEHRQVALITENDNQLKAKNEEIDKLTVAVSDLSDRLRKRPQRPQSTSGSPGVIDIARTEPALGCTGAQLYREDGLVLAGEAQRADRIRINLVQCQAAYESVSKQCGK